MTSVDFVRVFQGADDQWYYESKSANGQVLSTSEGYTRRTDAVEAAFDEHGDATAMRIEAARA